MFGPFDRWIKTVTRQPMVLIPGFGQSPTGGLSHVSVLRTVTVVVPPAVIATGWAGEYAVVHDAGPRQPSAIAIGERRCSDTAH